ncbi:efflux RND transporter periplasmic adaptor subunit [Sphingomonas turrisvirgatae]|uniref:Efflux transporter periplasmic adaptor subunit n=1 Tax=Sphingomonas turrisvirgatae TaxID=1888892 RepID=A0A1E3M176_9SPHN|nr:efflux RND transporter periplasmic adaptor subunit [Sphingomonas turrisvirgatae]ODP39749.1 efflux transporter periplasmic adaptor subunit [Sphingomonas turrisvirgatae]
MNYEAGMLGRDEPLALTDETQARSRRKWLIIGAVLVVVAIAIAWFAIASGKRDGQTNAAASKAGPQTGGGRQLPTVTVAVPGRQSIELAISGTGSLAARREMPVGVAGEGGMVTRVLVEPGSWVGAGQVLATVDRSVQAQTAQSQAAGIRVAQADLDLAQANLDRAQRLVSNGFVSKADIDRLTATRDAAAARVRVARAQLGETTARNRRLDIRAPAAGLVLTRQVEPGQIISSGTGTLFRIAQGGQMELRAQLSEADLQRLSVGARAEVTPVGTTQTFVGQVWQVSPVIDPQTRQGIARIALAYDKALRPGGFASARIVSGGQVAPLLPQSAVQSDNKGNFVYVLNAKDEAERRAITTGDVSDAGVAITSGLTGTERVVLTAGAFLNPGQKVIPNLTTLKR